MGVVSLSVSVSDTAANTAPAAQLMTPPKITSSDTVMTPKITSSSNLSTSPPPPSSVVVSPCAACKILRRRCAENCVLAPYFPPTEPLKFTTAHRVFGASNIIKFLQELPESQRADAVSSMVYEANARIRDPVYGCAGAICQLQKQVNDLQAQLAKARAQVLNVQFQLQAQLMTRFFSAQSPPSGASFPPASLTSSPSSSTLSPPPVEELRIIGHGGYFPNNLLGIDDDDVPGSCCAYLDVDGGGVHSFGWEAADMILG